MLIGPSISLLSLLGLLSLPRAGRDNLPVDIVGELQTGQLLTIGLLTSGSAALSHRESSGHSGVQGLAVVFPGVNSAALIIDIYTLITIISYNRLSIGCCK